MKVGRGSQAGGYGHANTRRARSARTGYWAELTSISDGAWRLAHEDRPLNP